MTRAWVVYESMFGNTRQVAQAIADGLAGSAEVEIHEVGHAPALPPDLALLVLGAPTHAFGLSRPSTREDASRTSGRAVESSSGIREWLDTVRLGPNPPVTAVFDTRVRATFSGSAAKKMAKRLQRLGGTAVLDRQSYWVDGTEGPLVDGEIARARSWGRDLAGLLPEQAHRRSVR